MPHCLAGQIVRLQIGLIKKLDLKILVFSLFAADHHSRKRVGVLWPMKGIWGEKKCSKILLDK